METRRRSWTRCLVAESHGFAAPGRPGRCLTPAQLQEMFGVSENTIYHELRYGSLKQVAFRVGRQWRVSEVALERLMAERAE